jgi:hypothetical protein
MNPELRVAVDVGVSRHRVAVGLSEGVLLEEFEIGHDTARLAEFFARVGRHERRLHAPVAVAMEGYTLEWPCSASRICACPLTPSSQSSSL